MIDSDKISIKGGFHILSLFSYYGSTDDYKRIDESFPSIPWQLSMLHVFSAHLVWFESSWWHWRLFCQEYGYCYPQKIHKHLF